MQATPSKKAVGESIGREGGEGGGRAGRGSGRWRTRRRAGRERGRAVRDWPDEGCRSGGTGVGGRPRRVVGDRSERRGMKAKRKGRNGGSQKGVSRRVGMGCTRGTACIVLGNDFVDSCR